MSLTISDFKMPQEHPYSMLEGYKNASEKESMLTYILVIAIDKGELYAPVDTKYSHPDMVSDGLLEKVNDVCYKLTRKAVGLLWIYYGKEQ